MSENSLRIREKYISKLFKKIQDLEDGIDLLGQVDRRILRNSIQTGGAYLNNLEARSMYLQRGGASSSPPRLSGTALPSPGSGGALTPSRSGAASPLGGGGGSGTAGLFSGAASSSASPLGGGGSSTAGLFSGAAGAAGAAASAGSGAVVEKASLREIQEAALIAKAKLKSQETELTEAAENINKLKQNTAQLKKDLLGLRALVSSIKIQEFPEIDPNDIPSFTSLQQSIQYNAYHAVPWDKLVQVPDGISDAEFSSVKLEIPPGESKYPKMAQDVKDSLIAIDPKTKMANYSIAMYDTTSKNIHSSTMRKTDRKDSSGKKLAPTDEEVNASFAAKRSTYTKKYLSNSVTSSEMPDNTYMLSETSFF